MTPPAMSAMKSPPFRPGPDACFFDLLRLLDTDIELAFNSDPRELPPKSHDPKPAERAAYFPLRPRFAWTVNRRFDSAIVSPGCSRNASWKCTIASSTLPSRRQQRPALFRAR